MNKYKAFDYIENVKDSLEELKDNVFHTVYASKEAEKKDFNACLNRIEKNIAKLKNEYSNK